MPNVISEVTSVRSDKFTAIYDRRAVTVRLEPSLLGEDGKVVQVYDSLSGNVVPEYLREAVLGNFRVEVDRLSLSRSK